MPLFQKNITPKGRWIRAIFAVAFAGAALAVYEHSKLFAALLIAGSVFSLFEALRGWCILRACGIKTRV